MQNRKNYVCLRGGPCPITIATRKKCPACRFEKCLQRGMKLEAIREDRTRGGRSTYQCSYTLPMLSPSLVDGTLLISNNRSKLPNQGDNAAANAQNSRQNIPTLLQVSETYSIHFYVNVLTQEIPCFHRRKSWTWSICGNTVNRNSIARMRTVRIRAMAVIATVAWGTQPALAAVIQLQPHWRRIHFWLVRASQTATTPIRI